MKKFLCIVLTISMLCFCSIPINANNALDSESNDIIISNNTSSLDIVSKDMSTGEVTYSTFKYEPNLQTNSTTLNNPNNIYTESTQAWFPQRNSLQNNNNTGIAPCTIWGSDNRTQVSNTKAFPYSTICYLEATFPDGSRWNATAFMIHQNIAITAAHAVYKSECQGLAEKVKVTPGKDGYGIWNNPFGTTLATSIHTSTNYPTNDQPSNDWALIVLEDNIGEKTGWLGIGWSNNDFTGVNITISGYPSSGSYHQYAMSGNVTTSTSTFIYTSTIDTSEGQSGSPMFTSDYTVCAIYCCGVQTDNYGPRITQAIYNFFLSYIN